jgi:hypothetical protein
MAEYHEDPQYLAHETAYMSVHPIGNEKVGKGMGPQHPSAIHQHLANDYGGVRTANHVRGDIRHGLNMLKESGVTKHGGLLTAEDMGHSARAHLYVEAQSKLKGK